MTNLVKIIFLILFASASAFAQLPPCSGEKPVRFPFPGDFGGRGPHSVTRVLVANPAPNAPVPVNVFYPSTASPQNRVPVIFFSHAYGAINYVIYEELIEQLVSNGYALIYPAYQTTNATNPQRYEQLWQGFVGAVAEHGTKFDLTRVGFAGHSFGGGATPEMARRGVGLGWGTDGLFIASMAPWYNWGNDMGEIPATAKLLVQVYWDDNVNDHLIAQNDVWNRLSQVVEKKWMVIGASRGPCVLEAGHNIPTGGGTPGSDGVVNSYDAWGVWRRLHALADYSLRDGGLPARHLVFGGDARMGQWRGIFGSRPLTSLVSSSSPITNSETNFAFKWSQRCLFADGAPCP